MKILKKILRKLKRKEPEISDKLWTKFKEFKPNAKKIGGKFCEILKRNLKEILNKICKCEFKFNFLKSRIFFHELGSPYLAQFSTYRILLALETRLQNQGLAARAKVYSNRNTNVCRPGIFAVPSGRRIGKTALIFEEVWRILRKFLG